MIDAAGAIYVIGGYNGGFADYYEDVWVSTDGGAQPDSVGGVGRGMHQGDVVGITRVLQGY